MANLVPVSNCAKEVQREIAQIRFLMSEDHGGGDCRDLWVMSIKKERPNLSQIVPFLGLPPPVIW